VPGLCLRHQRFFVYSGKTRFIPSKQGMTDFGWGILDGVPREINPKSKMGTYSYPNNITESADSRPSYGLLEETYRDYNH
ncbi:MAG: hypothetical protein ACE10K_14480, partial [Rhodothermales bacterium]